MIWIPKEHCEGTLHRSREPYLIARHKHYPPDQSFQCVAVLHRTCHGVVGFNLNDGTKNVDCESVDQWANGSSVPYPRCPKTVLIHHQSTRTQQAVPKYNCDKSRLLAMPVKPCVQRQFQVFLFGLQSVVCSDHVVLHRYRRHLTIIFACASSKR